MSDKLSDEFRKTQLALAHCIRGLNSLAETGGEEIAEQVKAILALEEIKEADYVHREDVTAVVAENLQLSEVLKASDKHIDALEAALVDTNTRLIDKTAQVSGLQLEVEELSKLGWDLARATYLLDQVTKVPLKRERIELLIKEVQAWLNRDKSGL